MRLHVFFLLLICTALLGCSIPQRGENREVITLGENNGTRLERRHVYHYEVIPISAEGILKSTYNIKNEYWLVEKSQSQRLLHLDDDYYHGEYLNTILGVAGTDLWVAFRLEDVQFSKVGIRIDVFDRTHILYSQQLGNVIRVSRCVECSKSIDSYSIHPDLGNSLIRIDTTSGVVSYDVKSNILRKDG